ncbi:MAG TPA: hypothetical protein P5539_05815, partial [Mesotoga sp.]|nr:hypothetical protein [Mesotoga sp.]
ERRCRIKSGMTGRELSSRSAPIRDPALALSKERRCRIKSGMTGRELSSRNAPIRDLALLTLSKDRDAGSGPA